MTQKNKHSPFCRNSRDDDLLKDVLLASIVRELFCSKNMNIQLMKSAPEMLAEMEKLAQALEDTGFEPDQSFYDVIKKAREMNNDIEQQGNDFEVKYDRGDALTALTTMEAKLHHSEWVRITDEIKTIRAALLSQSNSTPLEKNK